MQDYKNCEQIVDMHYKMLSWHCSLRKARISSLRFIVRENMQSGGCHINPYWKLADVIFPPTLFVCFFLLLFFFSRLIHDLLSSCQRKTSFICTSRKISWLYPKAGYGDADQQFFRKPSLILVKEWWDSTLKKSDSVWKQGILNIVISTNIGIDDVFRGNTSFRQSCLFYLWCL